MTKEGFLMKCARVNNHRAGRIISKALVCFFLFMGLLFLFLVHSLLSRVPANTGNGKWQTPLPVEEIWIGDEKVSNGDVRDSLAALRNEVEELKRIKVAAINDLRDLEGKRYTYQENIKKLSNSKLDLVSEIQRSERGLRKLKNELRILQSAVESKKLHVNIPIGQPKKLVQISNNGRHPKETFQKERNNCLLSNCFDFSHCSLLEPFSVFVYKPSVKLKLDIDFESMMNVYMELSKLPHITRNPDRACIFVDIVVLDLKNRTKYENGVLARHLNGLKNWENNGQNHLVILLSKKYVSATCRYAAEIAHTKAMVATSTYCMHSFREYFDLLLYPIDLFLKKEHKWDSMQQLVPIKKKYFFTFIERPYGHKVSNDDLLSLRGTYVDIYIKAGCNKKGGPGLQREFLVNCQDKEPIDSILKESTFNILFSAEHSQDLGSLLRDVLLSIVNGAIPVIIGRRINLPFSEFIDYQRFVIFIPGPRVTEAHYILRTLHKSDIFIIRKHGRFIYETYFGSLKINLMTVFSAVQSRADLPPLPLLDFKSVLLSNEGTMLPNAKDLESTQVISTPFNSNWTSANVNLYERWNVYPGGHYLLKYVPRNNALPPSVQFFEDVNEYMPIGNGVGGDGNVFKNALGGDKAVEHFTVVILTYNREVILVESLQRLSNLKFLNRVIVIWNNPIMPSKELEWPNIGVPVHVIKGEKNSLNNRFIPFDLIDTEAILSMDDDIYLRDDEIELAFRIWRENRDRIVGFPGRFHSWNANGGWSYNANHSCELSMVLTGGAFFHKYYSYLYTYLMPQPIRSMVDQFMNCEDIAMNFLVAHVTGRPPIKVTSRWTFRCPGCPSSLSNDNTHYTERAQCLQFFKKVYGYMPLRRTQFRADSVLFKTRLSPTERKCYQFV